MITNSKQVNELYDAIMGINWLKTFKTFASNPFTGYVYTGFNRYLSYYGEYFISEQFIKDNNYVLKRYQKRYPVLLDNKIIYVYNVNSVRNLPEFTHKEKNILLYMEDVKKYMERHNINEVLGSNLYSPMLNCITIQKHRTTKQRLDWLYHEIIHSTGHHARLDRPLKNHMRGITQYDEEEMIAIIGSSLLSGNNILITSINYIRSHIEKGGVFINKDKILYAFEQAGLAVDYILKE